MTDKYEIWGHGPGYICLDIVEKLPKAEYVLAGSYRTSSEWLETQPTHPLGTLELIKQHEARKRVEKLFPALCERIKRELSKL